MCRLKEPPNEVQTIIDIIKKLMRILRIVHNKCTSQTITVLGGEMAVIPECTYVNKISRRVD